MRVVSGEVWSGAVPHIKLFDFFEWCISDLFAQPGRALTNFPTGVRRWFKQMVESNLPEIGTRKPSWYKNELCVHWVKGSKREQQCTEIEHFHKPEFEDAIIKQLHLFIVSGQQVFANCFEDFCSICNLDHSTPHFAIRVNEVVVRKSIPLVQMLAPTPWWANEGYPQNRWAPISDSWYVDFSLCEPIRCSPMPRRSISRCSNMWESGWQNARTHSYSTTAMSIPLFTIVII